MSQGQDEDSGAEIGFATARGRDWPSVRQFNVFLANRMGALLELVKRFETTDVKLVALTVVETADCAIIRIVPSNPERGFEIDPDDLLELFVVHPHQQVVAGDARIVDQDVKLAAERIDGGWHQLVDRGAVRQVAADREVIAAELLAEALELCDIAARDGEPRPLPC